MVWYKLITVIGGPTVDLIPGQSQVMGSYKKQSETEYVRCDLCGGDSTEIYHEVKSFYGSRIFTVVRCRECGLIYVNPRPAHKEWFTRYHSSGYAITANPQDTFLAPIIGRNCLLAQVRLRHIQDILPHGRILDFGCGNGAFVYAALSKGWDAVGIDINEGLIKAANNYWQGYPLEKGWKNASLGMDGKLREEARRHRKTQRLFATSLEVFSRKHVESFDCITSSQVLEHLVSPSKSVGHLVTMLKKGGWLITDVPNIRCWRERVKRGSTLNPTAHLHYFDRATMRQLLQKHGLEVISLATRTTLLGLWMKIMPSLGLDSFLPLLVRSMRLLPDLSLSSDLVVVAKKK